MSAANGPLLLWYRQPAAAWVEALPVGNGRLGAMVFGGVGVERLQLNEDTLWAGGPRDVDNPRALENLPEVRRLLFEGRPQEAADLAERTLMGEPRRLKPYQPLGDLILTFQDGDATGYRRQLDLATGIARVAYEIGSAAVVREVFASAADQVIVVRLQSQSPQGLTFDVQLQRERHADTTTAGEDGLLLKGRCEGEGMAFQASLRVRVDKGGVSAGDRSPNSTSDFNSGHTEVMPS